MLDIARHAVAVHVGAEVSAPPPRVNIPDASGCGLFVSVHKHGALRGCIGTLRIDGPLDDVTADCAVSAAFRDPRFPPLEEGELPDVDFEISVLTPPLKVGSIGDIEVGRHGLIVESGSLKGLLLPQVAVQYGWDRNQFLRQTAIKAGLDPESWPSDPESWPDAVTIFTFEATVFDEAAR